jgi:hypothetical protein
MRLGDPSMLELVEKPVPEPGDGEVRIRGWCRASIRPTGSRAAARSAGWRRRRRCPTLLDRCARLAWHRVPAGDCTRDRGHGRVEVRTLKAVSVRHFGFPHAAQVLQVICKTRDLGSSRWRTVTVYAITSLPFELARPARLADLLRGHWVIENGPALRPRHCLRRGRLQVRTGSAPHATACLRNLAIGVLSRAEPVNLAAALRRHTRDPRRPWPPSG